MGDDNLDTEYLTREVAIATWKAREWAARMGPAALGAGAPGARDSTAASEEGAT